MINVYSGETADIVWQKAHDAICQEEATSSQVSRLGLTRELLHVCFSIGDPRQRWVFSRYPGISPAFAIAEVFWILSGSSNSDFINYWNPALPHFIGNVKQYYGAYGYRIRKQYGVDQLELAYNALNNNPSSRQVVIQIWDPRTDLPNSDGTPRDLDIPCNISSMLKVRNGELEWMQIMRSNDLYRGTPYNIVQFTVIQEIISGWLGLNVGSYNQVSDSLHVYEHDLELFKNTSSNGNFNTDSLAVTKSVFDSILPNFYGLLLSLSCCELTKENFNKICQNDSLPQSYKNLLLITAADSARRRGWKDEVVEAISYCTNQALITCWEAWNSRWQ